MGRTHSGLNRTSRCSDPRGHHTNHGLPIPFDQPGWNHTLDDLGVGEFFDGVITALKPSA